MNWRTFWEQLSVSIDSRSHLSDSEELVYLRHSFKLKDGSAKGVIEGLSQSGKYYTEAVKSLKVLRLSEAYTPDAHSNDPRGCSPQGGRRERAMMPQRYCAAAPQGLESDGLRALWSIYYVDTIAQTRHQHYV